MRARKTGLVLLVLLGSLPACKNMWNGPPQLTVGCSAVQGASGACKNMLRADWKMNPKATAEFIENQTLLPLTKNPVKANRKTVGQCRKDPNSNSEKKLAMSYDAPVEMKNFPTTGTNGNDLVVAVFTSDKNTDCPESKYGVLEAKGNEKPGVVYFVTVTTDNVQPLVSTSNRQIGEWTSWKIYKDLLGAYKLEELRQGAYIQCAKRHDTSYGDVAFSSCKDAHIPPSPSRQVSLLDRYFTIRSAHASIARGSSADFDALSAEVDPAWGRCGALGCCASY